MCPIVHYLNATCFLTKSSQSSIQLNKETKKSRFSSSTNFQMSKPKHDIADFSQKKNAPDGVILKFKPSQLSYKTYNNENSH